MSGKELGLGRQALESPERHRSSENVEDKSVGVAGPMRHIA